MHFPSRLTGLAALLVTVFAVAADKPRSAAAAPAAETAQPAVETLDLDMYQRIRVEGLTHSHVMEFASALSDGIGGRLTGSPNMKKANEWTRDELTALGCVNAHTEDWGEFGMGWHPAEYLGADDLAGYGSFHCAGHALVGDHEWSGKRRRRAGQLKDEKDMDQYKGKLGGQDCVAGRDARGTACDQALFHRYDEKELKELSNYPVATVPRIGRRALKAYLQRQKLDAAIAKFLADEKPLVVIRPSRDSEKHGGSGGTIFDDNGATIGRDPYKKQNAVPLPVVVTAIENYGRVVRLLKARSAGKSWK